VAGRVEGDETGEEVRVAERRVAHRVARIGGCMGEGKVTLAEPMHRWMGTSGRCRAGTVDPYEDGYRE
jgi:hypothetical protein